MESVTTEDHVATVKAMVGGDTRVALAQISAQLGPGHLLGECPYHPPRRLVLPGCPHMITEDQKMVHMDWSGHILNRLTAGESNGVWEIVSSGETVIQRQNLTVKKN